MRIKQSENNWNAVFVLPDGSPNRIAEFSPKSISEPYAQHRLAETCIARLWRGVSQIAAPHYYTTLLRHCQTKLTKTKQCPQSIAASMVSGDNGGRGKYSLAKTSDVRVSLIYASVFYLHSAVFSSIGVQRVPSVQIVSPFPSSPRLHLLLTHVSMLP